MKLLWHVLVNQAHHTEALVFLISRVLVRVLVLTLVFLSKTRDHYCSFSGTQRLYVLCVV